MTINDVNGNLHSDTDGRFTEKVGTRPSGGSLVTEPEPVEDANAPISVRIGATALLRPDLYEALPEWPAGLPQPTVSYDFDADQPGGGLQTYLHIGGESVCFWGDQFDGVNSWLDSADENELKDWDDDTKTAINDYGCAVFNRVDSAVSGIVNQVAYQPGVQEAIIAAATGGRPASETNLDDPAFDASRSASRVETAFNTGWVDRTAVREPGGDYTEEDQTAAQDALTDLLHWAHAHGTDLQEAFDGAQRMYNAEVADANG